MNSLQFTAEKKSNGVVERDFIVGEIPGVLWSPPSGAERAPLVLMGHGGGTHKKWPAMTGRAHLLVTGCTPGRGCASEDGSAQPNWACSTGCSSHPAGIEQ